MLLRTFTPRLADMTMSSNTKRKPDFKAFDKFLDSNPATKKADFNILKMQGLLLSKINGASDNSKQKSLGDTFSVLFNKFKESKLPDLQEWVRNK